MFNHQPSDYMCPFCELRAGNESELNKTQDIVFQNEYATALVAPKWWINNQKFVDAATRAPFATRLRDFLNS
jgi:histidine triad (HIT) family protein